MRVSEFQIYAAFLNNLQRLRLENLETQAHISTGKKVLQPSDDPIAFGRIVSGKASLAVAEQRLRNIQFGTIRLDAADNALGAVSTILSRLKELAVQLRNDTNGPAERASAAAEAQQLFKELQLLANTRVNGQPIFTGTSTHGRAQGVAITTPVTLTNGVNDTLVVSVDGTTSGSLDLTSGTESLSGSQLAERLQSRINADATLSAASKSVTVTFETDRLVIASNGFSSTSTVLVTSGTALSSLGFNGGSSTTGSNPFVLAAHASGAVGNTGNGVIAQGQVRDSQAVTLDDYVLQFNSSTSFSVYNISRPVAVTPSTGNAGGAAVADRGVGDPGQVRRDTYEIRPQSLFTVTTSNNALRFDPGSGAPATVTLTAGRYTGDQLASALKTAMDAGSGGDTYTVTFNGGTGTFSIVNDTGNAGALTLLVDDAATTAEALLGITNLSTAVPVGGTATGDDSMLSSGAALTYYVHNTTANSAMFTITASNNTLYRNGSAVTLTSGSYTGAELATEMQTRLGTGYTVAYSTAAGRPSRLFTITNSTGGAVTFNHSNALSTVSDLLGYEAVDSVVADAGTDVSDFDAGTGTYLSGSTIAFGGLRVVLQDNSGAPRHGDIFTVTLNSELVLSNQTYTSQAAINFEGLQISIQNSGGAPATNDLFRILVNSQYQGDSGLRAIEVQDNQTVKTNLPGNQVFSGTTIDVMAVAKNLAAALNGDYGGGIEQSLSDVDSAFDQVTAGRGEIGTLSNRLASTSGVLNVTTELLTKAVSQEEDADLVSLISDLVLQEVALQAAAEAGARIFETSLLRFLR